MAVVAAAVRATRAVADPSLASERHPKPEPPGDRQSKRSPAEANCTSTDRISTVNRILVLLLFGASTMIAATSATAEISRRDQNRAAQRAYRESARDYNDAAKGLQRFKRGAERVRDGAMAVERYLLRRR